MTLDQINQTAKAIQAFAQGELAKAKAINGLSIASFEAGTQIIYDVIQMVDQVKMQFADVTNDQLQDLAVQAVGEVIDSLLQSQLGTVGKIVYSLVPASIKTGIAKAIINLVVSIIHKAKAAVSPATKPTVAVPVVIAQP
jgi:flagellar biosynthesis/type III secretory pathway protein FliH